MTGVTVLRAADRRAQPWKNGGGVTRDVIVWPPNCGPDRFDWRVSIAEVATAGPFSRFEGVDRVLTVLEGQLSLKIAAYDAVRLTRESPSHFFHGDVAVDGAPIDGVVRDLNVMTRRGLWRADVRRVSLTHELEAIRPPGDAWLVVACNDLDVAGPGWKYRLGAFDAVFAEASQNVHLSGPANASAICVDFLRVGREGPR